MRLRRLATVLVCYLLSGGALLASLMLAAWLMALSPRQPLALIASALMLLAWGCHLAMSLNWVLDRRMGRRVPVAGTFAALAAAMLWPWMAWGERAHPLDNMLGFSGLGLAVALPCVLLAIWLVRFHLAAA